MQSGLWTFSGLKNFHFLAHISLWRNQSDVGFQLKVCVWIWLCMSVFFKACRVNNEGTHISCTFVASPATSIPTTTTTTTTTSTQVKSEHHFKFVRSVARCMLKILSRDWGFEWETETIVTIYSSHWRNEILSGESILYSSEGCKFRMDIRSC